MFITRNHISRRTVLRGMGATVALPLLDAMVPAGTAWAKTASAPGKTRLVCIEMVHGSAGRDRVRRQEQPLVAGGAGQGVRSVADEHERARAVPRLPDDRQQHRLPHGRSGRAAGNRRRSLPLERGVPDPGASEADAGLGCPRRAVARSDLRAALRAGHGDPVDAAVHRERRSGGRVRVRLRLRLHRLGQLGDAVAAAADDSRSARGVRSAVRHGRDARRARGAPQGRSQHPRLDQRRARPRAHAARSVRSRAPQRLSGRRARDRAAHPDHRSAAMPAARCASCPARRPACPTTSTSTSS